MSQGPGTRIIARNDKGTRTVNGVTVWIEETIWNEVEDSPLYDVYLGNDDTGELLTENESLDDFPSDKTIDGLLKMRRHAYHMTPVMNCSSCEAISPGEWRERYSERYEGE